MNLRQNRRDHFGNWEGQSLEQVLSRQPNRNPNHISPMVPPGRRFEQRVVGRPIDANPQSNPYSLHQHGHNHNARLAAAQMNTLNINDILDSQLPRAQAMGNQLAFRLSSSAFNNVEIPEPRRGGSRVVADRALRQAMQRNYRNPSSSNHHLNSNQF